MAEEPRQRTVTEEIQELEAVRDRMWEKLKGDVEAEKEISPMLLFFEPGTGKPSIALLVGEAADHRAEIIGQLRQAGCRTLMLLADSRLKDPDDWDRVIGEGLSGMLFFDDGTVRATLQRYERQEDGSVVWEEKMTTDAAEKSDRYAGKWEPSFRGGGEVQ